jgi:hypothetical protein
MVLSDEERTELVELVRSKLTSVRLAQRSRMVLLAADGLQNKTMAQLGVSATRVSRHRGGLKLPRTQRSTDKCTGIGHKH